jgi:hypothetical protein
VKIYVAAVQALRRKGKKETQDETQFTTKLRKGKKETQDETQFTTKIGGKTSLGSSYFLL